MMVHTKSPGGMSGCQRGHTVVAVMEEEKQRSMRVWRGGSHSDRACG